MRKTTRILLIGIGIGMLLPAVWYAVFALLLTWHVQPHFRQAETRLGAGGAPGISVIDVEGIESRTAYATMLTQSEFDPLRRAFVTIVIPISDLRDADGTVPFKDLAPAVAEAEATRIGEAECALILTELAGGCRLHSHDTRVDFVREIVEYTFSYEFWQKAPVGDPRPAEKWHFNELEPEYATRAQNRYRAEDGHAMAKERQQHYRLIARGCDEIRKRYGNCSIHDFMITTQRADLGSLPRFAIRARASYATLQPDKERAALADAN